MVITDPFAGEHQVRPLLHYTKEHSKPDPFFGARYAIGTQIDERILEKRTPLPVDLCSAWR